MSTEKLKLEVLLALTEKVLKPLKSITGGSNDTAKALKAAKDQLKELNDAQKRIDGFRKVDKDLAIVKNQLTTASEKVKTLKLEMEKTLTPTKALTRAFNDARKEAADFKGRITVLTEKQQRLRTELNASGMDTKNLATHQRELAANIAKTTAEYDKQTAAMKAQNAIASKVYAARANYQKAMALSGTLKSAGMNTIGIGIAGGLPIVQAVRQYASFEDAMLGVARQVNDAKDANGNLTATYYEMGRSIQAMSERLPLTANEIAAIVEAGARMGIQGKRDLLAYAETTAIMSTAFNLPVEQIGDGMAKVAMLYKVPISNIKQLGDAINWLDDNALSKGGDIIDVLQRIGGTATTLHMTYKEAAALGSTFLSLGNGAETAASASEHMMKNLAIATMLPKRFQGGMAMIGMNSRTVQNAMSTDALGTIVKVMEAINKLPQQNRIEAATRLFGKEFGPDAAKLAGNLDELRRQIGLVNAEKSKGSADREMATRNRNLSSGYKELMSTLRNLASDLGSTFKPELTSIMQSTAGVLKGVRDWVREHPGLAGALMKSAAVLAIIVTAVGALIFALGAAIVPLALARYGLARLGISAAPVAARLGQLLPAFSKIQTAAKTFGLRVAEAWQAAAPRAGGIKATLEKISVAAKQALIDTKNRALGLGDAIKKIPAASKQALIDTKAWALGLGGVLKTRLSAAKLAVADYTRQVWAAVIATRTAAATKFTAAITHVRARGVTGIAADAGMGAWNLLKGGTKAALGGIGGALRGVAQVLIFVGRAALMNPIGLIITGIALAALLVIKYWQPLKAFFSGFWQGLKEGLAPLSGMFDSAFAAIGAVLAPLKPVWDWIVAAFSSTWQWISRLFAPFQSTSQELDAATKKGKGFGLWLGELIVAVAGMVGKFFSFGKNIVGGLIDGIISKWAALKALVGKLGNMLPEWMRKPIEVHSPSRVFARIGGYTMEGLEDGILRGQARPLAAIADTAKRLAAAGAGLAIGSMAFAGEPLQFDTRAPLAPAHGQATAPGGNTYVFQITAAPGMDEEALAQAIERKIRALDSQRAARGRSRLGDRD